MTAPVVLVVDDVSAIVEELLTLMQLHRIPGVGAADLDGAIAALEREPTIRVISCDVRLDRCSGLEIVDRIANHPVLHTRQFRYLFVTGDKMQFDRLKPDPGMSVLSKPVQPAALIATLQRLLAGDDV